MVTDDTRLRPDRSTVAFAGRLAVTSTSFQSPTTGRIPVVEGDLARATIRYSELAAGDDRDLLILAATVGLRGEA